MYAMGLCDIFVCFWLSFLFACFLSGIELIGSLQLECCQCQVHVSNVSVHEEFETPFGQIICFQLNHLWPCLGCGSQDSTRISPSGILAV